jgi:hypothetical protein
MAYVLVWAARPVFLPTPVRDPRVLYELKCLVSHCENIVRQHFITIMPEYEKHNSVALHKR